MNEQWVVPVLTGLSVVAIGGSLLLRRVAVRAPLQARLDELSGGRARPAAKGTRLTDWVENVGNAASSKKASVTLREQLTQAGYHNANAAAIFIGAKLLLLAAALMLAAVITSTYYIPPAGKRMLYCSAVVFFFLPNVVVASRRRHRCGQIRKHLPGAIDLLEICASAGMGLDQAWNSVSEEVRGVCPILADEMALTNLEVHLGASRTDAMRHMAKRTGAEELSSLVAMLLQSERFGTSVSDGLKAFATYMRETRSQRAQESAEKMSIKLIFPMVGFIFPAVVLMMAGPAFISLYRATMATPGTTDPTAVQTAR